MWPDRTLLDLFAIDVPILQAPMAGASDAELAIAVAKAGGLGALPAGMLSGEQVRAQVEQFRAATKDKPLNLNFLAHKMPVPNNAREHAWRERLKPYYLEFGIDPAAPVAGAARRPFDAATCAIVEEIKPAVVSFHYGLPEKELMARVKAAGCKIICSATTVEEARFLETNGCDAIIAQGVRGGGTSRDVPEHGPGHPGRIVCAAPAGGRCGQGAGDRDRRHCRRTHHGGGADAWCGRSSDRNGASVLPGGENIAAAPGGTASRSRRQHRRHQRVQRPAGARAGQPGHSRARACQRHRAGISARQRCVGALACKGSGAGLGRFFSHVRRTGRRRLVARCRPAN